MPFNGIISLAMSKVKGTNTMMKLKMAVAGVCLAMCAAAAEKELSYRVQVDGTDVPLLSEKVEFGSKHPDGK